MTKHTATDPTDEIDRAVDWSHTPTAQGRKTSTPRRGTGVELSGQAGTIGYRLYNTKRAPGCDWLA